MPQTASLQIINKAVIVLKNQSKGMAAENDKKDNYNAVSDKSGVCAGLFG